MRKLSGAVALPMIAAIGVSGLFGPSRSGASNRAPAPAHKSIPESAPASIRAARVPAIQLLTVESSPRRRPIPPGFLGLSLEYPALEGYAGQQPAAINPIFVQLIRNLAAGQRPVLRIGGVTTDHTWRPVPNVRPPLGVSYALTDRWLAVAGSVSRALNARLILGINLEADKRPLAAAEARTLLADLGSDHVEALELGNEPELYSTWPWYLTPSGRPVPGRGPDYGLAAFTHDFVKLAAALPSAPLAGPAVGSPDWMVGLPALIGAEPRLRVITLHRYPLLVCFETPASPRYPTIANLLSPLASRGLADSVAPYAVVAHAHHLALRIDEMNTISCGAVPAVGRSFASALWALDALFQMARVGVDGVNIHTYRGASDQLFRFTHVGGAWHAQVEPEYYGLLMFSQAAPPGSSLLGIEGTAIAGVDAWATRARDGAIRVVLINDTPTARAVKVRIPGAAAAASLERLQAPSIAATSEVTLGGRGFGALTDTGVLASARDVQSLTPVGGRYAIRLSAASATMITVTAAQG